MITGNLKKSCKIGNGTIVSPEEEIEILGRSNNLLDCKVVGKEWYFKALIEEIRINHAKISPEDIKINTSEYDFSYGHSPRGRGNWAFEIMDMTYFFSGYYTFAKKAAISVAQANGAFEVKVLP